VRPLLHRILQRHGRSCPSSGVSGLSSSRRDRVVGPLARASERASTSVFPLPAMHGLKTSASPRRSFVGRDKTPPQGHTCRSGTATSLRVCEYRRTCTKERVLLCLTAPKLERPNFLSHKSQSVFRDDRHIHHEHVVFAHGEPDHGGRRAESMQCRRRPSSSQPCRAMYGRGFGVER